MIAFNQRAMVEQGGFDNEKYCVLSCLPGRPNSSKARRPTMGSDERQERVGAGRLGKLGGPPA
jgi:hypothetical protein